MVQCLCNIKNSELVVYMNFCPKCGTQNDGSARFCLACGTPLQQSQNGNIASSVQIEQVPVQQVAPVGNEIAVLKIKRVNSFLGCAVPLTVIVDSVEYSFNNGDELVVNISPGVHMVYWKFWLRSRKQAQVNAVAGGQYYVEMVADLLLGGFKLGKNSILG